MTSLEARRPRESATSDGVQASRRWRLASRVSTRVRAAPLPHPHAIDAVMA